MPDTHSDERKLRNFERLAERRTATILKKLKLLGNLANRNNYSYSDEHVKQMFSAIDRELKATRDRFSASSSERAEPDFQFKRNSK